MKRIFIFLTLVGYFLSCNLQAQEVVWKDDFEDNKGWSEWEDLFGKAIIKDGTLVIKALDGWLYASRCKTNLDVDKDFTIKGEISTKGKIDENHYAQICFNYKNLKNYVAFKIKNGFVYYSRVEKDQEIEFEKDVYKDPLRGKKGRSKDTKLIFEVQKKGSNVMLILNEEEAIEVPLDSLFRTSQIAFAVFGGIEFSFDNIEILQ